MEKEPDKEKEPKTEFYTIMQILSIVILAVGILMALKVLTDRQNPDEFTAAIYAAAGIYASAMWWAIAIIVKAATKYLNNGK